MFFKLIQGLITTSCRFIKMTNTELHNVNDERERESANYRIWRRERVDVEERTKLKAPPRREKSAESAV